MGLGWLPRCLQGHERQTRIDVMGEKPIRPLASSDYTTSSHTLNSRFISPGHPSYSCERPVFLGSGLRFHETPATPRGSPAHHEAGEKPGSGSVCQGPRLMARCWCRHVTEPSAGVPHRDPVQPSANEPAHAADPAPVSPCRGVDARPTGRLSSGHSRQAGGQSPTNSSLK